MDANAAAGASFAALNQHAKQLSRSNGKYQKELQANKTTERKLNTNVIELKEELKMQKATYIAEVHSRIQYSKILQVVAKTVEEKSDDQMLVDEVNAIVEDCEMSYMRGPNGMSIDVSRMKTPGKKRRSLLGFGSSKPEQEEEEDDEGIIEGISKGFQRFFGGGEERNNMI